MTLSGPRRSLAHQHLKESQMSYTTQAIAALAGNHAANEVPQETKTPIRASGERDLLSGLNLVLSEVIDVGQDVREAHRKISRAHMLDAELDGLFKDLGRWAGTLAEEDEARRVSPLEWMPSVAGRKPRILWTDTPTDDEVRQTLFEHLMRLAWEIEEALGEDPETGIRAALAAVRAGVIRHLTALRQGMSS
jgi:hypothetical protein